MCEYQAAPNVTGSGIFLTPLGFNCMFLDQTYLRTLARLTRAEQSDQLDAALRDVREARGHLLARRRLGRH